MSRTCACDLWREAVHSCGQRVFDKRIIFKDKTQKYVHNTFYWWLSKSFSRNKVASKVSRFKKGTTRRFVIDARTTTHPPPRAQRRARFARTNPFPTPNSHRDGSNAFARVSSGAIELRAILRGCGVDDAFSHQSNRFQERRASLRAQLLGRHK